MSGNTSRLEYGKEAFDKIAEKVGIEETPAFSVVKADVFEDGDVC